MKNPLCSIVIHTYYRPRLLEKVLLSVLELDYLKDLLEVIVVVDPNDYEAMRVASRFSNKLLLKVIQCSVNSASACRNLGVKEGSGDIVAIVDDDVKLHSQTLRKALGYLSRDSKTICVVFPVISEEPSLSEKLHHGRFLGIISERVFTVFPVTVCWRDRLLNQGLLYREDMGPPISIHEDWELGSRIRKHGFKLVIDGTIIQEHLLRSRFRKDGGEGRKDKVSLLQWFKNYTSSYIDKHWWTFFEVMKVSPAIQRLEYFFYFINPLIAFALLLINIYWFTSYLLIVVLGLELWSFANRYWRKYGLVKRLCYPLILFTARTVRTYLSLIGLMLSKLLPAIR